MHKCCDNIKEINLNLHKSVYTLLKDIFHMYQTPLLHTTQKHDTNIHINLRSNEMKKHL